MRQSGMWRARWLSKTVEPEPGTLGWVFPVPWAGADGWGFQPDGDDGAYLCEETDFEFVEVEDLKPPEYVRLTG